MILRILLLFLVAVPVLTAHAADTRGLRVVAKDPATNQSGEVALYNKSYAVIIGIDRYKNLSPDRQLKNAVKDAKGIEATLKKQYRFDRIFTLHDEQASRDAIMRLLTSELPGIVGRDDALFIFWAGHGNQVKTDDGELGYLIPHDGNAEGIYGNVTMSQLKDDISRAIPAKHIFYAFDACYSGLLTTRSVDSKPRRDLAYLKNITKERVRQVLTAGSKGQEALDGGPRGHSVFTGRLIEVLEATGDYITANEIQAILKERVYQDARARGHEQTPGFGALYGGGDFVFVPNIQQKVQDNKAELAKIEAELKQLEAQEAAAYKHHNLQKQREAEQQRKLAEAKLKAELLRQQQLADEQKRIELEAAERKRLEVLKLEDEKRLVALKADLEKRKQNLQLSGTSAGIESAVAEIKNLHARIQEIESTLERELAPTRQQVLQRYGQKITELDRQQQSEFETRQEFELRIQKQKNDLLALRDKELATLDVRSLSEQQTAPLRERIHKLIQEEYSIPAEKLSAQLGKYDAEKQVFPVQISTRQGQGMQLTYVSMIKISKTEAPDFKSLFEAGLVRFDMFSKINKDNHPVVVSTILRIPNGKHLELPYIDPVTGMEFSFVKGGCFKKGNAQGAEDEKPVQEVCVGGFFMGRTEVTQGQWKNIMGTNPSYFKICGDNCPVENVSWEDAQSFLEKWNKLTKLYYRLPTENEWEYAARNGGQKWISEGHLDEIKQLEKEVEMALKGFASCEVPSKNGTVEKDWCKNHLSNSEVYQARIKEMKEDLENMKRNYALSAEGMLILPEIGWFWDKGEVGKTHPVGSLLPNSFNLYDTVGNVSEWTSSCYQPYSQANQTLLNECNYVLRGGSFKSAAWKTTAASRFKAVSNFRANDLGFRVVRSF